MMILFPGCLESKQEILTLSWPSKKKFFKEGYYKLAALLCTSRRRSFRMRRSKDDSFHQIQLLKSVQSTLSHLQSPPEQMQSQRNYGSLLSKSHLRGMILLTMLAQNRPKSKRQYFNRAICYLKIVNIRQEEATKKTIL